MWSKGSGSCGILFHALQRVFEIAETGAIVLRRVLTPDLYADIGGVVVQVCHQNLAYELVEMRVLLDDIADLRSKGTDKTVGQENAEKRTDKRTTDHLAQDFGRLVDRGHGLITPRTAATMPSAGSPTAMGFCRPRRISANNRQSRSR